jgi:hypothetical protein
MRVNVEVLRIFVDTEAINPTLKIGMSVEFYNQIQAPLHISGNLLIGNKVISNMSQYQIGSSKELNLRSLTKKEKDDLINRISSKTNYSIELVAPLSLPAIEYIEAIREKNEAKEVRFSLKFVVQHLETSLTLMQPITNELLTIEIDSYSADYRISQSDWIKDYAPKLGIGNFLLLELQIPEQKPVSEIWKERYERAMEKLVSMRNHLGLGNWSEVITYGRKFYEIFKVGEQGTENEILRDDFKNTLTNMQYDDDAIKEFHNIIKNFFHFLSKYNHETNTARNLKPTPTAKKEDAYYAYASAVGLLNFIAHKI